MCFSAEMSLAGAAIIGAIGIAGLRLSYPRRYLPLACVPFGFALQQLTEGLLWMNMPITALGAPLSDGEPASWLALGATYLYLFLAVLAWPVWIPAALAWPERQPQRRQFLWLFTVFGLTWMGYVAQLPWSLPPQVTKVEHSLQYAAPLTPADAYAYATIVLLPFFISSLPKIKFLGGTFAAVFFLAGTLYAYSFVSVWCFGSAFVSIGIYLILAAKDSAGEMSSQLPS